MLRPKERFPKSTPKGVFFIYYKRVLVRLAVRGRSVEGTVGWSGPKPPAYTVTGMHAVCYHALDFMGMMLVCVSPFTSIYLYGVGIMVPAYVVSLTNRGGITHPAG